MDINSLVCEGLDLVQMAEDMNKWPARFERGIRIRGLKKPESFLSSLETISFSNKKSTCGF
jgi:hypothetical protein